jgi:hypothetical protein
MEKNMVECHRCGSLLNHWDEPHECFPSPPTPSARISSGVVGVSNVGFWQEHHRRIRELLATRLDLSFSEVVGLATAPVPALAKAA